MFRWLVIGIGDITTKRVLPAILAEPRSVLGGIVTRDPAKARPYGVPAWTDFARALAECPADAVYVASPVFLHAPQTIAALEAGKHVLCEKPMALNYGEALGMQKAACASGRSLGVAYYRRLYPKVARARQLIESGAIGRPVLAEATSHGWSDFADGQRAWIADPKQSGGGPLRDVASHRIDLMNHLFGKPVRVSGHLSTLVQPVAVEDNATVLIEYESGVRGMVDVRWHSRVARDEFRIRGTEGEIDLSPLNSPLLVHPQGTEAIACHANLHYPSIEDFVSAVRDGRDPVSTGATALPAEWVMEQASSTGISGTESTAAVPRASGN
ncbi:MAG TPA: Gfo/Idh/MocA family oxidoreductase [Bryobacteraceae bacterium]|nr:Gfo/Idh/MocA family oxidoreductase [Bryobacteraceae bacterium]